MAPPQVFSFPVTTPVSFFDFTPVTRRFAAPLRVRRNRFPVLFLVKSRTTHGASQPLTVRTAAPSPSADSVLAFCCEALVFRQPRRNFAICFIETTLLSAWRGRKLSASRPVLAVPAMHTIMRRRALMQRLRAFYFCFGALRVVASVRRPSFLQWEPPDGLQFFASLSGKCWRVT